MRIISPPHPALVALEGRVVAESAATMLAMPLLRLGAPKGEGEPVLVLPGFMASDRSTWMLRGFLERIGYRIYPWALGRNRRAMMEYLPILLERLQQIADQHEMPARLIGWSRGGIIARELARERPALVDRVITLGTPVIGGLGATFVARWVQRELGMSPAQMARLMAERNVTPIRVPVKAIYSKTDGVVAWRACLDDETEDFETFEVISSHIGLGTNQQVLRLVARLLR